MSSSDDDGLPAWITNYRSPTQKGPRGWPVIELSSSDDDRPPRTAAEPADRGRERERSPAAADDGDDVAGRPRGQQSSQAAAAAAGGDRLLSASKRYPASPQQRQQQPKQPKQKQSLLSGMLAHTGGAADRDKAEAEPGKSAATSAAVKVNSKAALASARKRKSPDRKPATVTPAKQGKVVAADAPTATATDATAAASAAAAAALDSAAAAPPNSALAAAAKAAPKVAAVAGEVPVTMPERLPQGGRLIAELEALEGGATDLTGDSGAVGRVLVRDQDDGSHVQFDLKGIVYDARHAPLPGTLCVVNIGQTEAKVEAVMGSFLQLARAHPDEGEEDDHKIFMDEDDDDVFQPAYARSAAGESDVKPGKKKAVKKKAAAGGVKKPRKALAKKKPAAKPRAKPKPKGK